MSEWQECNLGEIYEFASGLSKPRSEFGSGYPFLSFKDVFYNYFVPNRLESLVQTDEKERQRCSVRRGDVFLTRTSETMDELGMSCVALHDVPDATFNGFTKRLRPKREDVVLPEYAGYFFRSRGFREDVMSMTTMSTRASLNNEMLGRLRIKLPPVSVQSAIGNMLLALDNKIELNRRMNETLEAMVRAIFRDWFVDFGPTRAKAEGRAPYLAPEIWDLFPDALDDGGEPVGWSYSTVGERFDLRIGRTPPRKEGWHFTDGSVGVPWLSIRDLANCGPYVRETSEGLTEKSVKDCRVPVVEVDTVLVSFKLTVGRVAIAERKMATNEAIAHLNPIERSASPYFSYCWMREFDYSTLGSTSSIATAVNSKSIKGMRFPEFGKELENQFALVVEPLFKMLRNNLLESSTLAQTRDLLLPKLMTGEIRLAEAREMIDEVA